MAVRKEMGNSFLGFLYEFPRIRVDNFDNQRLCQGSEPIAFYLLTHAHADHLKGLDVSSFTGGIIYCSLATRELLKYNDKYRKSVANLRVLSTGERHKVPYGDRELWLTLISSNHCPGSVMFLIESDTKSVLITGDIRAESWWCDQLPMVEQLIPYTSGMKQLDMIYLDTTYSYRGEPYIEMMFNHKGLGVLTHFLKNYPADDSVQFYLKDETIGFEEVWLHINAALGETIHSKREIKQRADVLLQCGALSSGIRPALDTHKGSRYHICGRDARCCTEFRQEKFNVTVKACINISLDQMMLANLPVMLQGDEQGLELIQTTPEGHQIFGYRNDGVEKRYLLPAGGSDLMTDEILFFYSRHSSYEECRHFVSLFNVKDVYPIVEDLDSWDHGFQMNRHFGDLCNGSTFQYDSKCFKLYGEPKNLPDSQRPWIQKNLQPNAEINWTQSLENVKSSNELSFKGQASFKNLFDDNPSKDTRYRDHQYKSLRHKGRILNGMNQYRVQKGIQDLGSQWLVNRKKEEQIETSNSEADDCDMARAMMQLNKKIASRQASTTTSTSVDSDQIALTSAASRNISELSNTNHGSLNSTLLGLNSQSDDDVHFPSQAQEKKLDRFKGLLFLSPQKKRKKQNGVWTNSANIMRYEKLVRTDVDYGFFGVHLQVLDDQDK